MAETIEEQQQIDDEWSAERQLPSSAHGTRCPECCHRINRHEARVGEAVRVCASCPCARYAHYYE